MGRGRVLRCDSKLGACRQIAWIPKQGQHNLTHAQAEEIQAKNFNHATQDRFDAIARGDYPEWELQVQIMEDGEHPELDFDHCPRRVARSHRILPR